MCFYHVLCQEDILSNLRHSFFSSDLVPRLGANAKDKSIFYLLRLILLRVSMTTGTSVFIVLLASFPFTSAIPWKVTGAVTNCHLL